MSEMEIFLEPVWMIFKWAMLQLLAKFSILIEEIHFHSHLVFSVPNFKVLNTLRKTRLFDNTQLI